MNLREVLVRPVVRREEQCYQELMHAYHYLGASAKISETLWYIALWRDQWVALLNSARPGSARHGIAGSAGAGAISMIA